MIKPRSLHHAGLRITDLSRSKAFYEELLGFEQIERPEMGFPGAWYGVGEGQLHLMQSGKLSDGIDPTNPHLAFELDDYEGAKQIFRERGIEFLEHGKQLWILDPDGYVVELRPKAS